MAKSNFIVRGGADFSSIKRELTKTQAQLLGFQTRVGSIMKKVAGVMGLVSVGKLVKDSTKMAMGVESSMDNIARNMGQASQAFQDWVKSQSRGLGMARADAYKYGSTFSNLLGSFITDSRATATETQKLMKAAAVISSKTGRTYDDTANRIRSGMLGSTEAIEDLGIYTQVSMLESTEAFKKFANGKSWAQLSFQTQQQIRLAAILEQTYKRYGDTLADTTQTRQAQFVSSLKNIQLSLGQAFLPIYNAVLPALTSMANAVGRVVSVFAQFTQSLFGKAKSSQVAVTEQQAAAMGDLGDATQEAGKKAKGALAGFDEIHQLAETDAGAGAPAAPGVTNVPAALATEDTGEDSKLQGFADKIKSALAPAAAAFDNLKSAAGPVISNIGENLKWFYDNILVPFGSWTISTAIPTFLNLLASALTVLNPIIDIFQSLGTWLWNNFLQPIAAWTGAAFITAMNGVSKAFKVLGDWMSQNKDVVIAGLSGILGGILAFQTITTVTTIIQGFPAALAAVKAGIMGVGAVITGLLSPIAIVIAIVAALVAGFVYFYRTNESFRGVVDGILNKIKDVAIFLWENVLVPFGQFLADVFVAAWEGVTVAAEWLWKNVLVPFGDFMGWLWKEVLEPVGKILADVLAVAFEKVSDIAKSFWENVLIPLGESLTEMFQPAVEAVSAVLDALWNNVLVPLGDFMKAVFKPIVEDIIDVFDFLWKKVLKPLAEYVGDKFFNTFDNIFRSIKDVIKGLKETFIGLMNFITGVFTGDWEKAWEGIKKIFKGVFDALWGIVKFPLNQIIDGINTLIGGLSKLKFDIPDWVPLIGGKKFGIDIPRIPKLARGGIVDSPTVAMIGERGPEAVVPLENTGFVDAIASAVGSAVLSAMQMIESPSEGGTEAVIDIDGSRLARILIPYLNSEAERLGFRPILQTGGGRL